MTISFFTKQQNLILIQIENADNKINLIEKLKLGLERVENVGIFSFSHSVFKRLLSQGCYKLKFCGQRLHVA